MEKILSPKISVIMSVCNGEKYVLKAIQSIIKQSFDNFEFLVIDDASCDNTWDLIKNIEEERISVFRNKSNLGLTKNLNKLLAISKGQYIARIDADDFSQPDRLEVQNKFLDENPEVDLVGSFCNLIDSDNREIGEHSPGLDTDCLKWSLIFRNVIKHSTTMFRKHLGYYDENFIYAQDHEMWSRSKNPFIIKKILADVRIHPESITWSKSEEQKYFSLEAIRRKIEFYYGSPVKTEEAKIIKLMSIHKSSEDMKEFDLVQNKDLIKVVGLYMQMANKFFCLNNYNQTIIDEVRWDLHGLLTIRPEIERNVFDEIKKCKFNLAAEKIIGTS